MPAIRHCRPFERNRESGYNRRRISAHPVRIRKADVLREIPDLRRGGRSRRRAARLANLRLNLKRDGVDGFLLPRADRHQNEYVPPSEERLAWLTGFTGSAGFLIVLPDGPCCSPTAATPCRRANRPIRRCSRIVNSVETTPADWIEQQTCHRRQPRLGYDPWLHTADARRAASPRPARKPGCEAGRAVATIRSMKSGATARRRRSAPVTLHDRALRRRRMPRPSSRTSRTRSARRAPTRWWCPTRTTSPGPSTSAAPMSRIRRCRSPSRSCRKTAGRSSSSTGANSPMRCATGWETLADIREPEALDRRAEKAGAKPKPSLLLDQATAADALVKLVEQAGGKAMRAADPITAMKAIKNETEIAGARAAQARDGAAMARFLAWFDREAPNGKLTEIAAVEALETFRRESGCSRTFRFRAFPAPGPNGAIVHYRVTRQDQPADQAGRIVPDRFRRRNTRTAPPTSPAPSRSATPTAEMRTRFTQVLKGHIAIARAVFPDGTTGAQLDTLARQYLWQAGVDFDHGTGHGVGSYLSVHEGPARNRQARHRAAQARHDPLQRARLLQGRRLRHPDRESGAGDRGARHSKAPRSR